MPGAVGNTHSVNWAEHVRRILTPLQHGGTAMQLQIYSTPQKFGDTWLTWNVNFLTLTSELSTRKNNYRCFISIELHTNSPFLLFMKALSTFCNTLFSSKYPNSCNKLFKFCTHHNSIVFKRTFGPIRTGRGNLGFGIIPKVITDTK